MNFYKALPFVLFALLTSCQIGKDFKSVKKDALQISKDIKSVRSALVPVDTLMMNAASGLLTELATTNSEVKMDSITARLNRLLVKYLNQSIKNLDTRSIGSNLTQGALDTLFAAENEERIKVLINNLTKQAGDDLAGVVRQFFAEVTSAQNEARLNAMVRSLFSEANSAALTAFLNRSIQGVELDSIGEKLANDVIAENLKPAIDSLVRSAVRSIFQEIRKDNTAKGFFSDIRNIMFLGIGLLGLIMAVLFWINRKRAMEVNRMFIHAIENMEGNHGVDAKRAVEDQARAKGMLKHVDKMIKEESLQSKKNTTTGAS